MKLQRTVLLGVVIMAFGASSFLLSGCAAEKNGGNPLGTETIGGAATGNDFTVRDNDARGVINGVYQPLSDPNVTDYPVRYTGAWSLIPMTGQQEKLFSAVSETPGDTVDVVGTFQRAVIEFYDPRMYRNPGKVGFAINGQAVGAFELARQDSSGNQIIEYAVTNPNPGKVATITMSVVQGNVVITGYWFVFP